MGIFLVEYFDGNGNSEFIDVGFLNAGVLVEAVAMG
jgi:hypothetical protein